MNGCLLVGGREDKAVQARGAQGSPFGRVPQNSAIAGKEYPLVIRFSKEVDPLDIRRVAAVRQCA
jgi:hypothetical protein